MTEPRFRGYAEVQPIAGFTVRDARPFQAGDTSASRNVPFPPPPAPFWSAIRRLWPPGRNSQPIVRGVALTRNDVRHFPAPLDIAGASTPFGVEPTGLITPHDADRMISVPRAHVLPIWQREGSSSMSGFLGRRDWEQYLLDEDVRDLRIEPASSFIDVDRRVGVQLETNGRRARHGYLYSEQVVYLKSDVRFEVGLEAAGEANVAHDVRPFGGESRLASIAIKANPAWSPFAPALTDEIKSRILARADSTLRVKLCLISPAVYSADVRALAARPRTPAWRPFWLRDDRSSQPPFLRHSAVRIVGAICGKAFPLGFWDTGGARHLQGDNDPWKVDRLEAGPGTPRPMYRCVPAGTVYFLELTPAGSSPGAAEAALDELFDLFWFKTLLVRTTGIDRPTFFGQQGFGQVVIGGWQRG